MSFANSTDVTNPGSAVSNREDLADWVSILAPEETPFMSGLSRSKAKATNHEWTMDTLAPIDLEGEIEGSDVDSYANKTANRVRVGNYLSKKRKPWMVSDIQQLVDGVGGDDVATAQSKVAMEIKRDCEALLLSDPDKVAGTSSTAARLGGLGYWVDSSGPSDVPADYRTPADSIHASGAFAESDLEDIITSIFRVSGKSQKLNFLADTALRRVVNGFAQTSGATNDVYRSVTQSAGKTLRNVFSVYESSHGMVTIMNMNPVTAPDTTNKDTGYLYSSEFLGLAELKPLGSERQINQGGGERGFVDWIGTLVVKNPGALGKVTAIA